MIYLPVPVVDEDDLPVELELDTGWLPNREFDSRARQLAATPSGVSFLTPACMYVQGKKTRIQKKIKKTLSKPLDLGGGESIEQVIRGKENKNQITHTELANWQFAEVYVGEEGGKKERKNKVGTGGVGGGESKARLAEKDDAFSFAFVSTIAGEESVLPNFSRFPVTSNLWTHA